MSRELEGKVAIVTGAATGIGKAIAFAFSAASARLVVNHHDTPDLAEAVAVAADVSSRSEFEALVSAVAIERFGPWDVLVNNAGIALVKPFGEVTEDDFDKSFQVNVKGTFHGCQLALSRTADRRGSVAPKRQRRRRSGHERATASSATARPSTENPGLS